MSSNILQRPAEFLKGVGTKRAELLKKELNITSSEDLLYFYPYRYVDRTKFLDIGEINDQQDQIQIRGVLRRMQVVGEGRKKRLTARLRDKSGAIDLVWFRGINWIEKSLKVGVEYIVFGRVNRFQNLLSIPHPEMEPVNEKNTRALATLSPIYPSTEKLQSRGLTNKVRRNIVRNLFMLLKPDDLPEFLPQVIVKALKIPPRHIAMRAIHFPKSEKELALAQKRLKFEELFLLQMRLLRLRTKRDLTIGGHTFSTVGSYFNQFYNDILPFELTSAQKRVIREIRADMGNGKQMNRLLQGDVGSGKTIAALLCMLIAIDNGFQACLMAPTEILARQHYQSLMEYLEKTDVQVSYLSGSVKGKARKAVLEELAEGKTNIIVGTHALLEPPVVFKNLGLAITDEQHRFGVAQRARLWKKSQPHPPHVLVMTATPIPRTLAMTVYGDLHVSVIDELPPGRKSIETRHIYDQHRDRILKLMREQIAEGRQVYVVFPLIEESEVMDLKNLETGYEQLLEYFPQPEFQISVVHGRMKAADKEMEMQRFVNKQTQIMVATTVIEVGVNVPNASVMIIENANRFGLSQLHQLRGRVGRGADQSYCVLVTDYKLSEEARERIQTMCRTDDGFQIAEADLRLRGPGNIEGTQQSGLMQLRLADLSRDGDILRTARAMASDLLDADPGLEKKENQALKAHLSKKDILAKKWSRIG